MKTLMYETKTNTFLD